MKVPKGAIGDIAEGIAFHEYPAGKAFIVFRVVPFVEGVDDTENGFVSDESGEACNVVGIGTGIDQTFDGSRCVGGGGIALRVGVGAQVLDPENGITPRVDRLGPEVAKERISGLLGPALAVLVAGPVLGVGAAERSQGGDPFLGRGAFVGVERIEPGARHGEPLCLAQTILRATVHELVIREPFRSVSE